jgi:hypothetical protein
MSRPDDFDLRERHQNLVTADEANWKLTDNGKVLRYFVDFDEAVNALRYFPGKWGCWWACFILEKGTARVEIVKR